MSAFFEQKTEEQNLEQTRDIGSFICSFSGYTVNVGISIIGSISGSQGTSPNIG